jgi:hypothetical protein
MSRKQNYLPELAKRAHRPHGPDGFASRELEDNMQAIGMLLLAAATAGDGFGYADPGVGGKKWLRGHLVSTTAATSAPPYNAAALAGGGAGMGAANGRRFTVTKSQISFLDPNGMQIGWQTGVGPNGERTYLPAQLTVPARYNFNQGYIYRLKITNISGRPAAALYPSIEVAPTTPATDAYLAHNAIPVQFTSEDFDQVVDGGNFVTKVIYLPDPKYQELAISGVETLVSTRLEPGVDPILEADKRGTILLIVRLGAIDLETPNLGGVGSPVIGSPPGGSANINGPIGGGAIVGGPVTGGAPSDLPPGTLPAGVATPAPGNIILDRPAAELAPAAPAAELAPRAPAAGAPALPAAAQPAQVPPPPPPPGPR